MNSLPTATAIPPLPELRKFVAQSGQMKFQIVMLPDSEKIVVCVKGKKSDIKVSAKFELEVIPEVVDAEGFQGGLYQILTTAWLFFQTLQPK